MDRVQSPDAPDRASAKSETFTVLCLRCGESPSIKLPFRETIADGAAFVCRKCAGYVEPERKRRRRVPPATREGREIPWADLGYRNPDGDKLSGESAVDAIACHLAEYHVTEPWMRAHTKAERDRGIFHQEALAFIFKEDLAAFDDVLKDLLDADERWVIKMRALGVSRECYLAELPEAAWRRLARKMDKVKQALKKKVALQNFDDDW